MLQLMISMINHTLLGTIRAVISTLTCTSMASTSTSNSECCLAVQAHDCKNTVAAGVPITELRPVHKVTQDLALH